LVDKIYIPYLEFPEINFMGLLIGPRGHTLKKLEAETGAKVSIRGKGAYKEGKNKPQPGDDEELHCYIQAETEEGLKKAVDMINDIISLATSTPEGENELKRQQLRELAMLNGTLRDEDAAVCAHCGEAGHRGFECPSRAPVVSTYLCKICGNMGHTAADCTQKDNPEVLRQAQLRNQALAQDYQSLMAEIGAGDEMVAANDADVPVVAPWQRPAEAITAPWQAATAPPPWQTNAAAQNQEEEEEEEQPPAPWQTK
jgi:splicing factor 1